MKFSVSATTRKQRVNEVHGKDYFFLAKEDFEQKIQQDELVEWERIYDNYYGTLKSEVETSLRSGTAMLFDIDVKGALSVRRNYPRDTVLIFIEPPSIEVLRERLVHRRTESEDVIRKRLERVPMELEKGKEFDHRVVNEDLDKAINEVDAVVRKALFYCSAEQLLALEQLFEEVRSSADAESDQVGLSFELFDESLVATAPRLTPFQIAKIAVLVFGIVLLLTALIVGSFDDVIYTPRDLATRGLVLFGALPRFPGDDVDSFRGRMSTKVG